MVTICSDIKVTTSIHTHITAAIITTNHKIKLVKAYMKNKKKQEEEEGETKDSPSK